MTFLELAKFLRQEVEITGVGPSAVINQTGQLKRLCDWTIFAYRDIQNRHQNWRWLRRSFTFNTVANDDSYAYTDITDVDAGAVIARFNHWWAHDEMDPYLAYLQSAGVAQQYRLIYMPWEQFKWQYRFGTQNASTPIHVSVDHQNNLCLGPKPNDVYVVTGDFQRGVQTLAADGDVPEMPTDYHELIPYYAMQKYGANSVAAEIFTRAELETARLMTALQMSQLPSMDMGAPLI